MQVKIITCRMGTSTRGFGNRENQPGPGKYANSNSVTIYHQRTMDLRSV